MKQYPPKWADRFLSWFCHPDLLEDLQGDLYELFEDRIESGRPQSASWLYGWWVIRSLRYDVIKKPSIQSYSTIMLKHHITIASRFLWRNKFHALLSVAGLAIGLTCFLLMGFYVKQEVDYDRFHSKKDRIYRVWLKEDYGNDKVFFNSITPLIFEPVLEENFPEVERVIQYARGRYLVGEGENRINERIAIIGADFLEVFDFTMLQGSESRPLPDKNSIILSRSYANKYFGDQDAVGQSLSVQIRDEQRSFTVTAIYEDIPIASSLQFDMAISMDNKLDLYGQRAMNAWFNVVTETYLLLKEGADISQVEAKTQSVVMSYLEGEVEEGVYQMGFQPLTDIHLNPEIPSGIAPVGNPDYVYILGIIGLIVLLTSGINYTTLSIGQSLKRRKEVGVRKVVGAMKSSLIRQYLVESVLISIVAIGLAVGLTYALLPIFNELTGAQLVLQFEYWHIGLYLALALIVGIMAGLYPALILSGLKVVHMLSGQSVSRNTHFIRKGMVAFQFMVTVFLITSTLIMQRQLNFLQSKHLGYDYQATVSVPLYPDPSANRLLPIVQSAMNNGQILKEKLLKHPEISQVGMGSHVFGTPGWANLSYSDEAGHFRQFRFLMVDPWYFEAFGIKLKAGKSFEAESTVDRREGIILNQAAVDYFGLTDPIGQKLPGQEFGEHRIIGVTDNFNFSSLHTVVEPLVISQDLGAVAIFQGIHDQGFGDSPVPKLVFKYTGGALTQVDQILGEAWSSAFPNEELNFAFVEENIASQYEGERRMNRLISVATLLSVLVAGLGLLGMTVLMINSRLHEIGIRKVIGASDGSIFALLARKFAPQLVVGMVLSVPLTLWLMRDWLTNFAYRISIGAEMFVLGAFISLVIALAVISYHTWQAARLNPVETIRRE